MANLFGDNDNNPLPFWHGLDLTKLPSSPTEAAAIGCRYYFTGQECSRGHLGPKYTSAGCVQCTNDDVTAKRPGKRVGPSGAARAHLTRAIAALELKPTYVPSRPCKHGHMLRWTSTNNCVECSKEARARRKERYRDSYFKKLYGIGLKERDGIAESQGGKCAICRDDLDLSSGTHVDHCHDTGKVRGILCSKCNQAIGLFRDNPEFMRSAAAYVETHKEAA